MPSAKNRIVMTVAVLLACLVPCCSGAVFADSTSTPEDAGEAKREGRFWGEFYNESTISRRDRDNLILFSHIREGVRFRLPAQLGGKAYLILRHGKDVHKDFWNNRLEAGIGLLARPAWRVSLVPYFELILGHYLSVPDEHPQPKERDYWDVRSGLIFWHGWEGTPSSSRLPGLSLGHWGDLYGDVSYHRNPKGNVVGYFHSKTGLRLLHFWRSAIGTYGAAYLVKDVNKDFWNNRAEIGPGIWLAPVLDLDLKVSVEWLEGSYFGLEGEDPNPYTQRYRERRAGATIWIGW